MDSRVFAVLVVLATLGSFATAQKTGSYRNWKEEEPILITDGNLQDQSKFNFSNCLETCVSGLVVVRKAWQLKNQWNFLQEERQRGLNMCSGLVEVTACKTDVETKAEEAKSQFYGSVFGLCVATFGVAFKIRAACFGSTVINEVKINDR